MERNKMKEKSQTHRKGREKVKRKKRENTVHCNSYTVQTFFFFSLFFCFGFSPNMVLAFLSSSFVWVRYCFPFLFLYCTILFFYSVYTLKYFTSSYPHILTSSHLLSIVLYSSRTGTWYLTLYMHDLAS